ncbi:MAG TPA: glycosyltransferase family 4 protein [Burkholderiaceae bacterium]|nr:glycosyltransferase family 4 protein [Burkholderiaceae bacterium]
MNPASSASGTAQRLNIAFVVDRFGNRFGGAEAYGVELMRELSQHHDVTVLAREYDPECDLRLPFVALSSPRGLPSWLRVLLFAIRARRATRGRFDIVHSHMNGFCGDVEVVHVTPVRYNWRVRSLPFLKRLTSYISPRVQTYLGLEGLRLRERPGHRAVAVSELIATQLRQAYGAQRNFAVVPPGVLRPELEQTGLRLSTRARLNYGPDDTVCLMVARNPMRKGLPCVLKALASLPGNCRLLVVGANAAARDHLYKNPEYSTLTERVTMLPETADVAPYFLAADIYVHPTLNDSFGMAPLEAMSYDLPVILSPAPWCGFAQYVEAGSAALVLSHPEAHEELAAAISSIANDPQLAVSLRAGGAQVVARHSWQEVARQYEQLYLACLQEREAVASVATVAPEM